MFLDHGEFSKKIARALLQLHTMKLQPRDVDGASVAVFIWDESGDCGGSAVLFGTGRFRDGEFFVERNEQPKRLPIPESAWGTLRRNTRGHATFGDVDYIVTLRVGPLPEGADISEYERLDIPILEQPGDS